MKYNYLLVIIPSKATKTFADKYRRKYAKYTSYHLPPHITIRPPFFLKDISESKIKKLLQKELLNTQIKDVCLNSFGYFSGKNNVVYFKPDPESIRYLHYIFIKTTNILNKNIDDVYDDYIVNKTTYNPHMTIAERVPSKDFVKIKTELSSQKFNLKFKVTTMQLYKQAIDSNVWHLINTFSFKVL